MDPTPIFAALSTFNQVLLTPPGQVLMTNSEKVVADLLAVFGVHLATAAPAPAAKT